MWVRKEKRVLVANTRNTILMHKSPASNHSGSAENENAIPTVPAISVSVPKQLGDALLDPDHGDMRHLLYQSPLYLFSFHIATLSVDLHIAFSIFLAERQVGHEIVVVCSLYATHDPTKEVY